MTDERKPKIYTGSARIFVEGREVVGLDLTEPARAISLDVETSGRADTVILAAGALGAITFRLDRSTSPRELLDAFRHLPSRRVRRRLARARRVLARHDVEALPDRLVSRCRRCGREFPRAIWFAGEIADGRCATPRK